MSGWSWNDEKGVDTSPATQGTWDTFVARNPDVSQFMHTGWPHYDAMYSFMPVMAKGNNVFQPTMVADPLAGMEQAAQASRKSPSPDWDVDAMQKEFEGAEKEPEEQEEEEDSLASLSSPLPTAGPHKRTRFFQYHWKPASSFACITILIFDLLNRY
ncbi:hypothetical protein B0H14DRAFT_3489684 [Mycena olivaceomarginata]|nr:hypothetical protein B0H14DRAFT_3489684 [Mycena olivaceomarginata]